jgi:hypothetical protein
LEEAMKIERRTLCPACRSNPNFWEYCNYCKGDRFVELVEKPQPRKSLLKAALIVVGGFVVGVMTLILYMLGVRF